MITRGAIWIAYGDKHIKELERSLKSFRLHSDLPAVLITDGPKVGGFDDYIHFSPSDYFTEAPFAYDLSPFFETLYLDTDCVVLGNLDYAWRQMQSHLMAMSIAPDSFVYDYSEPSELVRYNIGVFWFRKHPTIRAVFKEWRRILESDSPTAAKGCESDFALAVDNLDFQPFVLPNTYNLRMYCNGAKHTIHGPVKIWHSRYPVPEDVYRHNRERESRFTVIGVNGTEVPELGYSTIEPRQQSLLDLLRDIPNPKVAEIGVFEGYTSATLLDRRPDLHLTMIDPWRTYPGKDLIGIQDQAFFERAHAIALRRTAPHRSRTDIVRLPGHEASKVKPNGYYDLVFIDADHTYEAVKQDILDWWPKVKVGGRLCGHDFGVYTEYHEKDKCGPWGVKRAVDELFSGQYTLHADTVWCVKKE